LINSKIIHDERTPSPPTHKKSRDTMQKFLHDILECLFQVSEASAHSRNRTPHYMVKAPIKPDQNIPSSEIQTVPRRRR
jgi:hypothetical protein